LFIYRFCCKFSVPDLKYEIAFVKKSINSQTKSQKFWISSRKDWQARPHPALPFILHETLALVIKFLDLEGFAFLVDFYPTNLIETPFLIYLFLEKETL
jgi:hypothetical protein